MTNYWKDKPEQRNGITKLKKASAKQMEDRQKVTHNPLKGFVGTCIIILFLVVEMVWPMPMDNVHGVLRLV